jgi:hypothetical protein
MIYDEDEWEERVERFADPGGESALWAAGPDNPRNLPCPTCHWPNRLTERDVMSGYQCDSCANALENGMDIDYYESGEDIIPYIEGENLENV